MNISPVLGNVLSGIFDVQHPHEIGIQMSVLRIRNVK